MANTHTNEEEQAIDSEVERVGGTCPPSEKTQFKSIFTNIIQKGMTIMEAIKFPPALLELLYSYASELYNSGKYQDANKLFYYLVQINPKDPRFPFAYAASFHKLKKYEDASNYYMMAGMTEKGNPLPWFHTGDCYLQMQRPDAALVMLNKAINVAGNQPQYEQLKKQAEGLRHAVVQAIEENQ